MRKPFVIRVNDIAKAERFFGEKLHSLRFPLIEIKNYPSTEHQLHPVKGLFPQIKSADKLCRDKKKKIG